MATVKQVGEEADFLHIISSPLSGIGILLESVLQDLPNSEKDIASIRERIETALTGMNQMKTLLIERRRLISSE